MQSTLNNWLLRLRQRLILLPLYFALWLCSFSTQAASCQLEVTNLNFSTYVFTDSDGMSTNGEVRVNCDATTNFQIRFGTGSSQNYLARTLVRNSSTLQYNIFGNPTFNQILGDGSNGTHILNSSSTAGQPTILPFYGYIPPDQNIPVGAYQDNIVVTIIY